MMNIRQFTTQYSIWALMLVLGSAFPGRAQAQDGDMHAMSGHDNTQGALLKAVRDSTVRFKDVNVAQAEGYNLLFGCVTGPDSGAMGLHFVNMDLVQSGVVDATRPQIVIYEPTADGRLQLIGADFLVIADQWDKAHPGQGAPQLMGQLFQFFDSPNRFGLPPFYTLHVWAWKNNPNGAFVNWHPNVSCAAFSGQTP
jgi:hypothetical protein